VENDTDVQPVAATPLKEGVIVIETLAEPLRAGIGIWASRGFKANWAGSSCGIELISTLLMRSVPPTVVPRLTLYTNGFASAAGSCGNDS